MYMLEAGDVSDSKALSLNVSSARICSHEWKATQMTEGDGIVPLAAAQRVLAALNSEDRDELLASLVIAICNNPDEVQFILAEYIREHDFQVLVSQLDDTNLDRSDTP